VLARLIVELAGHRGCEQRGILSDRAGFAAKDAAVAACSWRWVGAGRQKLAMSGNDRWFGSANSALDRTTAG
jgi:hypothetical protein